MFSTSVGVSLLSLIAFSNALVPRQAYSTYIPPILTPRIDACPSVPPVVVSPQVMQYHVYVSTYVTAPTVIDLGDNANLTINNVPSNVETVVVASYTTYVTLSSLSSSSNPFPTTALATPAYTNGAVAAALSSLGQELTSLGSNPTAVSSLLSLFGQEISSVGTNPAAKASILSSFEQDIGALGANPTAASAILSEFAQDLNTIGANPSAAVSLLSSLEQGLATQTPNPSAAAAVSSLIGQLSSAIASGVPGAPSLPSSPILSGGVIPSGLSSGAPSVIPVSSLSTSNTASSVVTSSGQVTTSATSTTIGASSSTSFLLAVAATNLVKRQSPPQDFFILPNGTLQEGCGEDVRLTINAQGQLSSRLGTYSTTQDATSQIFVPHTPIDSVTTTFSFANGYLQWFNDNFTDGQALFCNTGTQLFATFDGVYPDNCTPVNLTNVPSSGMSALKIEISQVFIR